MSVTFIFFLIFAVLAVLALIGRGNAARTAETRKGATTAAVGASVLAALFLFLSSFDFVGTKNIGFVTWFNKPVSTVGNGWQWHAPWAVVHEWDGKLQNLRFSDVDQPDVEENGRGVAVRLGNQGTATVDLIFQYRITGSADTLELFRNYGDEKSVKVNAVQKAL